MTPEPGARPEQRTGRRRAANPLDAATPRAPVRFDKYQIVGHLARGGMADVYLALPADRPEAAVLAVKCMRSNMASQERFVEMFIREGKLAMLLDHPCIVRTVDVGNTDNRYFIAMEYIAGQDLHTVLKRCQESGRRLPVPHALHIAASICRALDYAHELTNPQGMALNVVNRDVSPSNVRLSYDGGIKLLDFGIAQAALQLSSEIGILKGKFAYMSPEQIRGLPLDRRTDIFSAGIVLHEMLSCERLFREESEFVLMEKVRYTEIRPPSAFNRRVPPEIDRVVLRALQREPARRYQRAAEMAAELEETLERYQFAPTELGELLRSLFATDYHEETRQLQHLTLGEEAQQEASVLAPTAGGRPRPRRRRRPHRNTPRPVTRKSRSPWLLWLSGALLLAAAAVVLALALR